MVRTGTCQAPPRWRPTSLALAILLVLTGCGGGSSVEQDLVLSGAATAHITASDGTAFCNDAPGGFAGEVSSESAGFDLQIEIRRPTFTGAGSYGPRALADYPPPFPTVRVKKGATLYTSASGKGAVSVDSGLKSGSVDMDLTADGVADGQAAHLAGKWRCG